jgi:hypothetical protein
MFRWLWQFVLSDGGDIFVVRPFCFEVVRPVRTPRISILLDRPQQVTAVDISAFSASSKLE